MEEKAKYLVIEEIGNRHMRRDIIERDLYIERLQRRKRYFEDKVYEDERKYEVVNSLIGSTIHTKFL